MVRFFLFLMCSLISPKTHKHLFILLSFPQCSSSSVSLSLSVIVCEEKEEEEEVFLSFEGLNEAYDTCDSCWGVTWGGPGGTNTIGHSCGFTHYVENTFSMSVVFVLQCWTMTTWWRRVLRQMRTTGRCFLKTTASLMAAGKGERRRSWAAPPVCPIWRRRLESPTPCCPQRAQTAWRDSRSSSTAGDWRTTPTDTWTAQVSQHILHYFIVLLWSFWSYHVSFISR